jgi:hypothetical protein
VVDKTRWQLLASLDYVSGGLIGFGTALALIGVELGEFNFGWYVYGPLLPLLLPRSSTIVN